MSASNAFETALLQHLLQNEAIANIGDATGLPGSAAAGQLYISLHTADPGEAGNQGTSEAAYTGYDRVGVARSAGGWTVTGASGTNAATIDFPEATGGTANVTHFGIGTSASGAGMLLLSGELTAPLAISNGITPSFAAGSLSVTVD